ncbi:MAG: tRNA (adenosine(37)-N6)-threonylcarbamoyltransferase complex dimerization subunit type 1 TsaB [Calditrichaeota bacterium]|nr:tRNA (adenosine(37)-N6)-threonylcarbamoyltransferase complex dimerization subunit type 1 TsaB [Calditrichota bacterium]
MKLLAVETATPVCGAALAENGRVLAEVNLDLGRIHAERLAVVVQWLLETAGLEPAEIGVVAVSAGPGSFTGLRIGFAFAKGFALPHGARLVAVPTLQALALNASRCGGTVCSLLRSRRGEFFAAHYHSGNGELREVKAAEVVSENRLVEFCRGADVVVGQTDALPETLVEALQEAGMFVWPAEAGKARASHVAILGARLAPSEKWADLETAEPFYLQEFVAKLPKDNLVGEAGGSER